MVDFVLNGSGLESPRQGLQLGSIQTDALELDSDGPANVCRYRGQRKTPFSANLRPGLGRYSRIHDDQQAVAGKSPWMVADVNCDNPR
jgi:hypothetical protein